MPRVLQEISLAELTRALRDAREKKGWTLEQLSHELWQAGYPTSQNKLWRMENKPPRRVDTELLLWLEKVLDTELIRSSDQNQILIDDVLELIDRFIDAEKSGAPKPKPPPQQKPPRNPPPPPSADCHVGARVEKEFPGR